MAEDVKKKLKRFGLSGLNKPKRSPKGKKSHIVAVRDGGKVKIIRFGERGASTAGKPKAGESARMKAKRKSFKARHRKNIAKGKTSAAWWANKIKWIVILMPCFF
jgi:hypothetical protein